MHTAPAGLPDTPLWIANVDENLVIFFEPFHDGLHTDAFEAAP